MAKPGWVALGDRRDGDKEYTGAASGFLQQPDAGVAGASCWAGS